MDIDELAFRLKAIGVTNVYVNCDGSHGKIRALKAWARNDQKLPEDVYHALLEAARAYRDEKAPRWNDGHGGCCAYQITLDEIDAPNGKQSLDYYKWTTACYDEDGAIVGKEEDDDEFVETKFVDRIGG